jgi:GDP-L-fucose synthase
MDKTSKIVIAGNYPVIVEAIHLALKQEGYQNIRRLVGPGFDLNDAGTVDRFFSRAVPDYVFLVGGKSGGIGANQQFPADLMLDNLLIDCHLIEAARRYRVKKLLYLASSCIYPKFCDQPMRPEFLMTGKLEPTNEPYAIAKLAGLHLCLAYRRQYGANFLVAIPANVFGPWDDFSEENSHVVGALIRRMHEAKVSQRPRVEIWGSGLPRREFIYSEDLADACLFVMKYYEAKEPLNLGVGVDWSVRQLADLINGVVGYSGELIFDRSKADGMPVKLLDSTPLQKMGWQPRTPIKEGLAKTYQWLLREGELVEVKRKARAPF